MLGSSKGGLTPPLYRTIRENILTNNSCSNDIVQIFALIKETDPQAIEKVLKEIFYSRDDFEEDMGLFNNNSSSWDSFWSLIFANNLHRSGTAICFARKWAEALNTGVFDSLLRSRKYAIMHYCIRVNPGLFSLEDILAQKNTAEESGHEAKKQWIELLIPYDPQQALNEAIALGDTHFILFAAPKHFFCSATNCAAIKQQYWDIFNDKEKNIFCSMSERYQEKEHTGKNLRPSMQNRSNGQL